LGSDFDGAVMPRELGDVTGLPKLVAALQAGGYEETDLAKITYQESAKECAYGLHYPISRRSRSGAASLAP
jgi:hypothetical protein